MFSSTWLLPDALPNTVRLATNQRVGSSNLSGRTIFPRLESSSFMFVI
jgi:hypothetical protein